MIGKGILAAALLGVCSGVAPLAGDHFHSAAAHQRDESLPSLLIRESSRAFTGVTVIDVRSGAHTSGQTVLVSGRRIAAVGPDGAVALPAGTAIVAASGKYVMPGLWDMHVHLGSGNVRQALLPFIQSGVTGIRELAQRFPGGSDTLRQWRRDIEAGGLIGPRLIGPSADLTYNLAVETPADVRRVFDSLKAAGDPFVKFHDDEMPADQYFMIMREARRTGLRVLGHVPKAVSLVEAIDSGHYSVDHFLEIRCWLLPQDSQWQMMRPNRDTLAAARDCAPSVAKLVSRNVWVVPTLRISQMSEMAEYAPREAQWFVRLLHRGGVDLLAGTDATWPFLMVRRWESVHRELELFVGAGLTPLEALRTATINPVDFLGMTDSLGAIQAGKLADFVVLEEDPTADIRHTTSIWAVVANGRFFDRAMSDSLRTEALDAGVMDGE